MAGMICLPETSRKEPSVTTAIALALNVNYSAKWGLAWISKQVAPTPGVYASAKSFLSTSDMTG